MFVYEVCIFQCFFYFAVHTVLCKMSRSDAVINKTYFKLFKRNEFYHSLYLHCSHNPVDNDVFDQS